MAERAIFIAYRRDDTADMAGRIYDRLVSEFGVASVFKDVDSIPVGEDFGAHIRRVLSRCRVVLELIGPGWLEHANAEGIRSLDNPRDWVRIELESALSAGVQIVPVLIHSAEMPSELGLPESLRSLTTLNAARVRRDPDFHKDMDMLIAALKEGVMAGRVNLRRNQNSAEEIWRSQLSNSSDVADLRRFAETFPGTPQSLEARRRIARLEAAAAERVAEREHQAAKREAEQEKAATRRGCIAQVLLVTGVFGGIPLIYSTVDFIEATLASALILGISGTAVWSAEKLDLAPRTQVWVGIVASCLIWAIVLMEFISGAGAGSPEEDVVMRAPASELESPPQPRSDQAMSLPEMVRIPGRNFEVGRYEVTFAQWDSCVAAGGCNGYRPSDEGWGRDNRPVTNVSWNDAQAYVQWLSQRTGQRYRLPTEVEWEYAARAGTATDYSWGNDPPVCDQRARNGANFRDCTDDRTRPAGSFQPNGFGLYDVHGNVLEWVEDCYDLSCSGRVLRGGSWGVRGQYLGSAYRNWLVPARRLNNNGFRVARSVLEENSDTPAQESDTEGQTSVGTVVPADSAQDRDGELQPAPPSQAGSDVPILLPEMVRVPGRGFEVGRYEVTFAQWDSCVAAGGCNGYRPSDEGWGRDNRPVINVSWNDAQAYVQWLSQRTGQRYRLLSSAEWEVAARAGTTTEYSWGDQDPVCRQNARNGANFENCRDNRTRPVGFFQPNGFGLYDVHGNVAEWVEDCGEARCSSRIWRGGSWVTESSWLRSNNGDWGPPAQRSSSRGFRVARAP